ncbi:AraC family transcriptional regulator [Basfia succiniciproducens]|uniref:AraC family transcriptional regulator n=1 Tax=Basfia succiniciproducens TaxID=653940 RepID=UPI0008C52B6F|nr:AraC family transcriptional regulator [Basfia succiniciproducens]SEQ60112.1 transcriptional regulator, AraC family [Basfia succiniciproducens]
MLNWLIRQTLKLKSGEKGTMGIETPVPELFVFHSETDLRDVSQLQESGICLILQGRKDVRVGDQHYRYQAGEFVCYTVDLPIMTEYLTDNGGYLDLRLFFDLPLMREIIDELNRQNFSFAPASQQKIVSTASPELIRAFEMLISLTENSQDLPIMLPLIKKAIYFYLLTGEQGGTLRQIALQNSNSQRIVETVGWLKEHYNESFDIEQLAAASSMSISGFYAQFRRLTGMSPLQYQKNLRLTKANALLKLGQKNISEIAFEIGYDSLPQFSREYKRYFGHSPRSDLSRAG